MLTAQSAQKQVFQHSHDVVLPSSSTLEPGDEFMLLSLHGNVTVRTTLRGKHWRLPPGVGATFMFIGLGGVDDWAVHGPWRIQ
jgi:hypothetical protein